MLAESWRPTGPQSWSLRIRSDVKWDNDDPVTTADVVHSFRRVMADPKSQQKQNYENIADMKAVSDHELEIDTKSPDASLMERVLDRLIITNKKIFDQYGEAADRNHTVGFGPYHLTAMAPGQYVSMTKVPTSLFAKASAPDELIIRNMKEPEQRITALLKGEIQIAQYVPPHMIARLKSSPTVKVTMVDGIENAFLAMNPNHKPWDNKKLRQAVAYAIDRDTLIKVLLSGLADRLDGPVGPGQYAYDPNLKPKYTYDPERAKALVREAGFPKGVNVTLVTAVNRYVNDKQIAEAIVAMLDEVGIHAKLDTPETGKMSVDVQNGAEPFYMFTRGSIIDPSQFLSQYFETGISARIGYSNPALDVLMARQRASFDPEVRMQTLREIMSVVTDEAPAHFLWRLKMVYAMSKKINYAPGGGTAIYGNDISFN
jgi:peptide/nickel transport system substrate-binding protein